MSHPIKSPRKLIEVALPLDAVNTESAREKAIRHGHPSTLHLWWARRPLAAVRAMIFAQLVNDPGFQQGGGFRYGMNKKDAAAERKRLFALIEDLVLWDNTDNEDLMERARTEIRRSWREVCELNKDHPQASTLFNPERMPSLHDPFAGGGTIPLEAQRLGLVAQASDLNPVAVAINKAMIEIPPRFFGLKPVGPEIEKPGKGRTLDVPRSWPGYGGLAEDISRYGAWIRGEAQQRIGALYPPVVVTAAMANGRPDLGPLVGKKLTVVAWLWARTVKSPNPAFKHVDVPLASTFVLCSKPGKEAYVHPVLEGDRYHFTVRMGAAPPEAEDGTKLGRGANFACLVSGAPIEPAHIYGEATARRLGARLMAVVAESAAGRVYLPPTATVEAVAAEASPQWAPDVPMPDNPRWFSPPLYGLTTFGDLFTPRQLVALSTFSDLVGEARERIYRDAIAAGWADDGRPLRDGGAGAQAYAEAISLYLAFCVDKMTDTNTCLCSWQVDPPRLRATFGRQALPMVWDYAEANVFGDAAGDFARCVQSLTEVLPLLPARQPPGTVTQLDAATLPEQPPRIFCTDPPYYDNIGYADLSDFFYVWLRRSLKSVYPEVFATVAVPKAAELVATPYRHGGKEQAETFFLAGMTDVMRRIAGAAHPAFPITIYYAFKQSDRSDGGMSSTGWVTFLEAVKSAGMSIVGTWPVRTEMATRNVGRDNNALASSIVLVCRERAADASVISRREFVRELNAVLPVALDEITQGSGSERSPVAPVDLSQAIIGPGMAVFSKYAAVLEADGTPMSVRAALQLINRFVSEDDFDHDTQFCLRWFEQHGWKAGRFGDADTLARAKGTAVEGVRAAGVIESGGGAVRLLRWSEYAAGWDPVTDSRNPVWETLHHLLRALRQDGESAAGRLLAAVKDKGEPARQLAYRLYTLCERQGWLDDARSYNELITSWSAIEEAASAASSVPAQRPLFD